MRWKPRRRSSDGTEKQHDRWLLTYSDLITLLLILFVFFYSISTIDESKFETMKEALLIEKDDGPAEPNDKAEPNAEQDQTKDDEQLNIERLKEKERKLQESLKAFQAFISANKLESHISFRDTDRGIAITLKDLFLFDTGKADLKTNAYPLLDELAKIFTEIDNTISIEGHTDSRPLFTGSVYRDNWGLSSERSLSVLRYFIYEKNLDPAGFLSAGFADTVPVADNDSEQGRAKNRRVEIVILR